MTQVIAGNGFPKLPNLRFLKRKREEFKLKV